MDGKYNLLILEVNATIREFSEFLKPEYRLSEISYENLFDKKFSWNLKKDGWHDIEFPSNFKKGVYFLFGCSEENNLPGVYVGKASFNSCIGSRLFVHLNNPKRDEKIYPMKDGSGESFLMEFVTTLPLNEKTDFLASSLEEYIIKSLSSRHVKLINKIGRS